MAWPPSYTGPKQSSGRRSATDSSLPLPRSKYPVTAVLVWLLVVFLVLLPKGGIKVGTVPLTWGYLLLALTLAPLTLLRLFAFPLRAGRRTLIAFASIVPFQILFLYSVIQNGVGSAGLAISTAVNFIVLPFAFLLVYPTFLSRVDGVRLARQLCFCIFAAAVFGIFLFVLYPLTGHLLEVPYVTVNADDYGLIESTKHISRGAFLKLISTYNNGNLYGVAMLILLPLYSRLEDRAWRRNLLKFALILTLSRTVWFGLVVDQMLSLLRVGLDAAKTFPKVSFGPALRRAVLLLATAGAILFGLVLSAGNLSFLFDRQLGGRAESLAALLHPTFLPAVPPSGFLEITYATALSDYGITGFLSIVLIFALPIALFLSSRSIRRSPLRTAAFKGLILYMIVSCIDGAVNLIPVMAFYWFVYMVFLEGWPGGLDLLDAVSPPTQLPVALAPSQPQG